MVVEVCIASLILNFGIKRM